MDRVPIGEKRNSPESRVLCYGWAGCLGGSGETHRIATMPC